MIFKIKKMIDRELVKFIRDLDKNYALNKISPLLYTNIKDFISRDGKRIRPTLFLLGYLGYKKKPAAGIYRSAISLELLHDFMLVHDDIIDKSNTRRGKLSMHAKLNKYLARFKNIKFRGEDLAIVLGDIMFAMALHAFLFVKEEKKRKEAALKKIIEAAFYTGGGEFIELILGLKNIDKLSKNDIYKIYDLKTANYTFASPLTIGATLAGAKKDEISKLYKYGLYLGRAFQIKDDILGLFSTQKKIGKSVLTDLQESKKTILVWAAYKYSDKKNKSIIKKILAKNKISWQDLLKMRKIIIEWGALDYAKKEINNLMNKAASLKTTISISTIYKSILNAYTEKLLSV